MTVDRTTLATLVALLFASLMACNPRRPRPTRPDVPESAPRPSCPSAIGYLNALEFPGATAGDKIRAAIDCLPDAYGGVVDAQGFVGINSLDLTSGHDEMHIFSSVLAYDAAARGTTKAGKLLLGAGVFTVTKTIQLPSNWTVEGIYSGARGSTNDSFDGSVLRWAGRAGGTIWKLFNTHNSIVQGVAFDCASLELQCTAILLDADQVTPPSPGTTKIAIRDFGIYNAAIGIQWGPTTRAGSRIQADAVTIENGDIRSLLSRSGASGPIGIVINSENAAQTSKIDRVSITSVMTGIWVQNIDQRFEIHRVDCGNLQPAELPPAEGGLQGPACIQVDRAMDLLIQDSRNEIQANHDPMRPHALFLLVNGLDYEVGTLTLIHDEFNGSIQGAGGIAEAVYVQRAARIASIGNRGAGHAHLRKINAIVTSIGDRFPYNVRDPEIFVGWEMDANGSNVLGALGDVSPRRFSQLLSAWSGVMVYCSDCGVGDAGACSAGGAGAFARVTDGQWICSIPCATPLAKPAVQRPAH